MSDSINPPVIGCESLDLDALSPRDQAMYVLGVCAAARTLGHGTGLQSEHVVADRHACRVVNGTATGEDECKVRNYMQWHLERVAECSVSQRRWNQNNGRLST